MEEVFITYIRFDIKTMCYIVFISQSLHWHYIKIALQEYVIKDNIEPSIVINIVSRFVCSLNVHK